MAGAPRRPLVAGNWKMNGLSGSAVELGKIIAGARGLPAVDLMVCPPATLIAQFAATAQGSPVRIGGQDCHAEPAGAFTGDLSAEMLKDAGASAVIVGHSERRSLHGKPTRMSAPRRSPPAVPGSWPSSASARPGPARRRTGPGRGRQRAGSLPDGATAENLVVAYEPVWAIGSRLTPTPGDVAEMRAYPSTRRTLRRGRAGDAHPLWRLGETGQRPGADGRRRRRRRAGRRREPEGRRAPGDRGRLSIGFPDFHDNKRTQENQSRRKS